MDVVLVVGLFCALIFLTHLSDKNVEKSISNEPPKVTLPPPKRFVSVVFREGQTKLYDYFIGENYDLRVGDYVEVPVRNKFTGESELKIATVKYVSRPGERSERAWATVIGRVTYQPPPVYNPQPKPIYNPLQPVREVNQTANRTKPQQVPVQNIAQRKTFSTTPEQLLHELLEEDSNYSINSQSTLSQSTVKETHPSEKRFVQVIFKKHGKKRFDYFLGSHYDLHVGDFVVVHVNNSGKTTWKIAKIVYISKPGEISKHAKSEIIKKADYPKW